MEKADTKIIFWGTMAVALPSLEALLKDGYQVVAVVTTPDKPAGRKQILTPSPVKVYAQKHHIPVFQPTNLKDENFKKELPEADLYIVIAYGKIIPKDIIERPKFGSLNGHPSLLPRWRGPSPTQFTILNGDTETGVTIFLMDERMDHGSIIATSRWPIVNRKITNSELHDKLAKLRAELLVETLPPWLAGEITPLPQDDAKATYSKILKKDDGRITWSHPAEEIERTIRAFNPWPGTWTLWPSAQKIYRLRLEEAEITPEEAPLGSPGYVWNSRHSPLLVKTGQGNLVIKKLTLAGKKSMDAKSFLNGYTDILGATLI